MYTYTLDVPYSEKDTAKEHGARWNNTLKKWTVHSSNENCYYLVELFNGYINTPKTNVWKLNKCFIK